MVSDKLLRWFGVILIGFALLARGGPVPPVDCNCVANLGALQTNACQGIVPDLCALGGNCFSTNLLAGSCSQTPAAGTIVGAGTNNILLSVMDAQSNVVQYVVSFNVSPPTPSLQFICGPSKTVPCGSAWFFIPVDV
jgi:hypothetical protein